MRLAVRNVGAVFVQPAPGPGDYAAAVVDRVTVAYKSPPRRLSSRGRRLGNYPLPPKAMDRMRRILEGALVRAVEDSRNFTLAQGPGPGVLRLSGHVRDLVWEVPPAEGSESSYVLRTGSMTLIVDAWDSETNALVLRIADRRHIRPNNPANGSFENSPANNWAGVESLASHWCRLLGEALDALDVLPERAEASASR